MSNAKNNNIFEKTSFLGSNSSKFIEQLYADYLQKPEEVPNEWRDFFNGLKDKKEEIIKTIKGPSWSRKFKDIKISNGLKNVNEKINKTDLNTIGNFDVISSSKDSIRASMLIRAYRIRGHLISNLDPLALQKRYEHPELKPETYGFSNKDLKKRIFLDGLLGIQSATLKEIIELSKKIYCQNIGYEFMHMGDPEERKWIRDRIEGKEKGITFTENGKKAILNKLLEQRDLD